MALPVGKEVPLDIWQGENSQRFPVISNAGTYNLFEFTLPNSDQRALMPTAGFKLLFEVAPGSRWRGIFSSNLLGGVVAAIGNEVYLVTPEHLRLIFNIDTLQGKVFFEENAILTDPTDEDPGGQIAVSDGANIYIYQLDGTLTKATNDGGEELGFTPGMLAFQDSTFFCNDTNSNQIFQSDINDARNWPADKFGVIDNETRGCLGFKTMLFVFGSDITQIFHDTVGFPFTYTKDTTRSFEYGTINSESIGRGLDFFVWFGQTQYSQPTILMSTGGEPNIISTPGVDSILNSLSNPADNNAFVYEEQGHTFYQINFFADNLSLLYNFLTKKWYKVSNGDYGVHPIQGVATFQGRNRLFALSSDKGNIYEFGLDFFTNDGEIVPRMVITPNMVHKERPKMCSRLEIQVEQGANPDISRVNIEVSKDRGRVFRWIKNADFGPLAQRERVLRFFDFGVSKWWTFKLEFFSEDRIIILGALTYFL